VIKSEKFEEKKYKENLEKKRYLQHLRSYSAHFFTFINMIAPPKTKKAKKKLHA